MNRGLLVCALALVCACEAPSRPIAPGPEIEPLELLVEVLDPQSDQTVVTGRTLAITVRASEPLGRVDGIGYIVRRAAHEAGTLDSVVVGFAPIADTTHTLLTLLPDTFGTTSIQLDITGLARAGDVLVRSDTRHLLALHCPVGATWC